MDMDYKKVYEEWLTNPFFDASAGRWRLFA